MGPKACLGTRERKRKEWITADIWEAINTRKDLKKQLIEAKSERLKERYKQQYQEADRKVKRLARADKGAFMDDLASQAEYAAKKGKQEKVYKIFSNTLIIQQVITKEIITVTVNWKSDLN